jgi:hypothetical protein
MPAARRAGSLDLEPARCPAGPVPAAGGPGGGRERRADLRRRRREGCKHPGGPRPGGEDESGRCLQVAGLLWRASARRTRRGHSRSGRRRRRACRQGGESAARRCRRGAHPQDGGPGGERRRLGLDRAAAPGGQGECGGGSGAAPPGGRRAVLGGGDRGGRPAGLEVDTDVRVQPAGGKLPLAAVPAGGKVDAPRGGQDKSWVAAAIAACGTVGRGLQGCASADNPTRPSSLNQERSCSQCDALTPATPFLKGLFASTASIQVVSPPCPKLMLVHRLRVVIRLTLDGTIISYDFQNQSIEEQTNPREVPR